MSVGDDDTLASSAPTLAGGSSEVAEVVAGRYRIVRWLGGGGMGRVYEALDTELGEKVALKVLRAGISDDAIERFRREVRLTRRIQHKNVARMFDIGEHEGDKFLTMELVVGEPLSRRIGRPLAWSEIKALAEQLCAGLAAAHEAGVIHRDLKPDNVLVEATTGRAVITDFGIARGLDDAGVTQVGTVVGTPRYMAPEQLAGKDVDARADLFSLGVMLFELATGERPWNGDNAIAIAVQQATSEARALDPTTVPAAFATIVASCLALEPARRPASAAALGAAIAAESSEPLTPATRIDKQRSRTSLAPPPPAHATPSAHAPPPPAATPPPVHSTTVAVLPVAAAPADEFLAEGLREDLTDTLSTTPGLRVRPAAAVTGSDPREIGQRLAVDHVVVASLRRTPAGLRASARLLSVADGFQIWAFKADIADAQILTTSETIARGIAEALSTRAHTGTRPTDQRAVLLYLRARDEMRRFWGVHVHEATKLLQQAVELAPASDEILAAHAYAAVQSWVMTQQPELHDPALQALERALAAGGGEAHLAAAVYWMNKGDFERGGRELGQALNHSPMSGHVHELAGRILVEVSGSALARHHFELSVGLDPARAKLISADLARLEALEGNWPSADGRVAALLADPDPSLVQLGHVFRARLAAWRGDHDTMMDAATRFTPRMGDQANRIVRFMAEATRGDAISEEEWGKLTRAFGDDDDRPVRQQLMGLQLLIEVALVRDRPERALATLALAARTGLMDIVWLDRCPLFGRVAEHPSYPPLRAEVARRAERVLAALRSVTS
jgi:eukaryotic-like serine/threonine-protein kinase